MSTCSARSFSSDWTLRTVDEIAENVNLEIELVEEKNVGRLQLASKKKFQWIVRLTCPMTSGGPGAEIEYDVMVTVSLKTRLLRVFINGEEVDQDDKIFVMGQEKFVPMDFTIQGRKLKRFIYLKASNEKDVNPTIVQLASAPELSDQMTDESASNGSSALKPRKKRTQTTSEPRKRSLDSGFGSISGDPENTQASKHIKPEVKSRDKEAPNTILGSGDRSDDAELTQKAFQIEQGETRKGNERQNSADSGDTEDFAKKFREALVEGAHEKNPSFILYDSPPAKRSLIPRNSLRRESTASTKAQELVSKNPSPSTQQKGRPSTNQEYEDWDDCPVADECPVRTSEVPRRNSLVSRQPNTKSLFTWTLAYSTEDGKIKRRNVELTYSPSTKKIRAFVSQDDGAKKDIYGQELCVKWGGVHFRVTDGNLLGPKHKKEDYSVHIVYLGTVMDSKTKKEEMRFEAQCGDRVRVVPSSEYTSEETAKKHNGKKGESPKSRSKWKLKDDKSSNGQLQDEENLNRQMACVQMCGSLALGNGLLKFMWDAVKSLLKYLQLRRPTNRLMLQNNGELRNS